MNIESLTKIDKGKNGYIYVTSDKKKYSGIAVSTQLGYIDTKYNFQNGKLHGKVYEYNDDGNIISISNYKNNVLHGEYIEYDKNGNKILDERYNYGKRIGNWMTEHEKRIKNTFENNTVYTKMIRDTSKISISFSLLPTNNVDFKVMYSDDYWYMAIDTLNWSLEDRDTCFFLYNICDTIKYGECHSINTLIPTKVISKFDTASIGNYKITFDKPTYILFHYYIYPNDLMYEFQNKSSNKCLLTAWTGLLGTTNVNYYYYKKIIPNKKQ